MALAEGHCPPPRLIPAGASSQKTASDYDYVDSGPIVPYQPTANDFVPLRSDSF